MSKKRSEAELLPPEKWEKELNRLFPDGWLEIRRHYFDDPSYKASLGVPDWCYLPTWVAGELDSSQKFIQMTLQTSTFDLTAVSDTVMSRVCMATWRTSRMIYRFADVLYDELINQPLEGDIPCEALFHLPVWAVFVETPYGVSFEGLPVSGFLAHWDYNMLTRKRELQFVIFHKGKSFPRLVALEIHSTLADALQRVSETDKSALEEMQRTFPQATVVVPPEDSWVAHTRTFTQMLQLLLYLCSDAPDMPPVTHPSRLRGSNGYVHGPRDSRVWDVGVRISSAIRRYREEGIKSEQIEHASQGDKMPRKAYRPHIRSAHWHTYWTGPREAVYPERKPVVHWLPPIPVGMKWDDDSELPTVVHPVK